MGRLHLILTFYLVYLAKYSLRGGSIESIKLIEELIEWSIDGVVGV